MTADWQDIATGLTPPPVRTRMERWRSEMNELRQMTIEELAEDAFLKRESLKAHMAMNEPTEFEQRKAAAISLAKAQEDSARAEAALERRIKQSP